VPFFQKLYNLNAQIFTITCHLFSLFYLPHYTCYYSNVIRKLVYSVFREKMFKFFSKIFSFLD
jgi:hypothetical protein